MTYGPDILRAARHLIRSYGSDAAGRAGRRASELRAIGQIDAAEIWKDIARAIRSIETGETQEDQ